MTTHVSASRSVPVPFEGALERVLHHPLPEFFSRRYAALPAIKEVVLDGDSFAEVGDSRVIVLSDGGRLGERLTLVDSPHAFGYRITPISGPLKPLVSEVQGLWTFEPSGTGTRIGWSWTVTPSRVGRVAMPAFARMWRGYARQALEEIERVLLAS